MQTQNCEDADVALGGFRIAPLDGKYDSTSEKEYDALVDIFRIPDEFVLERERSVTHSFGRRLAGHDHDDGDDEEEEGVESMFFFPLSFSLFSHVPSLSIFPFSLFFSFFLLFLFSLSLFSFSSRFSPLSFPLADGQPCGCTSSGNSPQQTPSTDSPSG